MPRLVRLYITQTIIGFLVAALFVAGLLWFNVANLWHLVTHDSAGWMAVGLLWLFNGIVFSGVQFGISIMRMADTGNPPQGGRRAPRREFMPQPLRVRATADRPRRRI